MWDLIVLVTDHCLSFYFNCLIELECIKMCSLCNGEDFNIFFQVKHMRLVAYNFPLLNNKSMSIHSSLLFMLVYIIVLLI